MEKKTLSFTVNLSFYESIEMKEDVVEIGKRLGIAISDFVNHSESGLVGETDNFTTNIQITSNDLSEIISNVDF